MSETCILCKQEPAVGRTIQLYCVSCAKKDFLVKMAALQRDTRFKEGATEYQNECWGREETLKTNVDLSNHLQKKCVSFSKEHIGFKELVKEVKEFNKSIPGIIKDKIALRKRTKEELNEFKTRIQEVEKEISKIKDKKGKKIKEKRKELQGDLKNLVKKKKELQEELKRLKKKK